MASLQARVIGPDGEESLGAFIRRCKDASGLPVTKIAEAAGISRANYYLLEKDRQRPTLATMVALLGAMGLEVTVPNVEGSGDPVDLVVNTEAGEHRIDLRWSTLERRKSRDRYLATALTGMHATLTGAGFSPNMASALIGAGASSSLATAGTLAMPIALPAALGGAVYLATRRLTEQRAAEAAPDAATSQATESKSRSQDEALTDLQEAAASMPTAELEELLDLVKAMRDVREEGI